MNNLKKIFKFILIVIIILSLSILNTPSPSVYCSNYIEFYDKDNNLIKSEIKDRKSKYIKLNEINKHTIDAFIIYEDKNFYSHKGFDIKRIIKSFFTNLINFKYISGGSTITQQYARLLFLNNEKSLIRKIKEAYYTIKLETTYSKDEILEGYLNNIYLGHGCYGIEAASNYYFNKSTSQLTLEESALLASLPSSPNNASPINDYNRAMKRKNIVLQKMYENKKISQSEYLNALSKDISISKTSLIKSNLDYYLDKVKLDVKSLNLPLYKGLKIYTHLDTSLYNTINEIITKYENNEDELSIIILKNNSNKALLTLGGYNYNKSSYNRSLYSKRQIGSTIKTFLYAFALENKVNENTLFKSEKTIFNIKGYDSPYSPSNSNNIYANRNIDMREAYSVSDNIYATKTLLLLGSDNFKKYLNKYNLNVDKAVVSLALGSCEFTLFELANAYSVFANNGYYINYSFIDKVTDFYDSPLYTSSYKQTIAINKNINSRMIDLMYLPFKNNKYYISPTMSKYNINDTYGKTGSTKTDSYVVAITKEHTIAIRVGVDDSSSVFYNYQTPKQILKDITYRLKQKSA